MALAAAAAEAAAAALLFLFFPLDPLLRLCEDTEGVIPMVRPPGESELPIPLAVGAVGEGRQPWEAGTPRLKLKEIRTI